MVNDDSSSNILMNSNDFPDHRPRVVAGYYKKVNWNISKSVPMNLSESNNEKVGNMDESQQLLLPNAGKYKSIYIIQSLLAILKLQIIYYIKN